VETYYREYNTRPSVCQDFDAQNFFSFSIFFRLNARTSAKNTHPSRSENWRNKKEWSEYDFPEKFMTILGRLGM